MEGPSQRLLRRAYGFDEVAIMPGHITINPDQTRIELSLGPLAFPIPILAAAMDAVVDVAFALAFGKLGGLGVLNLEGIHTRYDDADSVLAEIVACPDAEVTALLQKIY